MTKNIWILILGVCVLLISIGCSREKRIRPLSIDYQGIVLNRSNDGLYYTGDVSSSGITFSISCSKPLTKVQVNHIVCQDEYGDPQLSGYWGNVYTHQHDTRSFEFHINENSSREDRFIVFVFGYGDEICKISLKQHHLNNELLNL